MVWTVIAINPTTERAETEVLNLSPDAPTAEISANQQLRGKTIVAMVRGMHTNATHIPDTTLSLYHVRK